jgi:hypothetical protein
LPRRLIIETCSEFIVQNQPLPFNFVRLASPIGFILYFLFPLSHINRPIIPRSPLPSHILPTRPTHEESHRHNHTLIPILLRSYYIPVLCNQVRYGTVRCGCTVAQVSIRHPPTATNKQEFIIIIMTQTGVLDQMATGALSVSLLCYLAM